MPRLLVRPTDRKLVFRERKERSGGAEGHVERQGRDMMLVLEAKRIGGRP